MKAATGRAKTYVNLKTTGGLLRDVSKRLKEKVPKLQNPLTKA